MGLQYTDNWRNWILHVYKFESWFFSYLWGLHCISNKDWFVSNFFSQNWPFKLHGHKIIIMVPAGMKSRDTTNNNAFWRGSRRVCKGHKSVVFFGTFPYSCSEVGEVQGWRSLTLTFGQFLYFYHLENIWKTCKETNIGIFGKAQNFVQFGFLNVRRTKDTVFSLLY